MEMTLVMEITFVLANESKYRGNPKQWSSQSAL